MSRDVRLVNHEDLSQDSKYTGQYMINASLFNNAKPFIHLKLDQACRRTMPNDSYDYELGFDNDTITLCLLLTSGDKSSETNLYDWAHSASESINALAAEEFSAIYAFPEDLKLLNLMKVLAQKLDDEVVKSEGDNHSIAVSVTSNL